MNGVVATRDHDKTHFQNHQLVVQERIWLALDMNKHAFVGALAGTVVSLCLHPIDTIKTDGIWTRNHILKL